MQPLRDGLAGAHRRREAARHELLERLQAGQPLFAQVSHPRVHQFGVGAAGAEAELARRERALDLRGEPRQLVQQRLVLPVLARDALGQPGERVLDRHHARREPARDRQRQQRQRAVGLDLEQPLHHAPGLVARERGVEEQEARAAVGVQPEVGVGLADAVAERGADHRVAAEVHRQRGGVARRLGRGQQRGVRGDDRLAGQRAQPALGQLRGGVARERRGGVGARCDPRVARELAVPLPFQAQRAERQAQVGGLRVGRRQPVGLGQPREVGALRVALAGLDQHRDVGEARGCR